MKHLLYIAAGALLLAACHTGPEPIAFGEDQCDYCKMSIADPKFGAELVTEKGRVYKFDALECMVPYMEANPDTYAHVLAIAYDDPETLYPVQEMAFVISREVRSPMGAGLLSFSARSEAAPYAVKGKAYDWVDLQNYLLNEAP